MFATSGPGATNLVTGITDAMIDSIPLVIFTGQVAKNVIGTDAFQEADVIGITTPITKYNYQVNDLEDLPSIVRKLFILHQQEDPVRLLSIFLKISQRGMLMATIRTFLKSICPVTNQILCRIHCKLQN